MWAISFEYPIAQIPYPILIVRLVPDAEDGSLQIEVMIEAVDGGDGNDDDDDDEGAGNGIHGRILRLISGEPPLCHINEMSADNAS